MIEFSIDKAARLVRTELSGPLSEIDLVGYITDVLKHPDYTRGSRVLVRCVDVQAGPFSADAVRRLAEFNRIAERDLVGSRVAVVAAQPAVYGLARMYELLRDPPYAVRVFKDLDKARLWLDDDGNQRL